MIPIFARHLPTEVVAEHFSDNLKRKKPAWLLQNPTGHRKEALAMVANQGCDCNSPPLKLHRQRGKRIKSSDPAVRRDAAFTHLEGINKRRQRELCRFIVERLLTAGEATADDCTKFEDGERRRVFVGAAFAALRKAGVAIGSGWVPSTVPRNHCRPVVRWLLADASVARQWMTDHPAPPPTGPMLQRSLPIGGDL